MVPAEEAHADYIIWCSEPYRSKPMNIDKQDIVQSYVDSFARADSVILVKKMPEPFLED